MELRNHPLMSYRGTPNWPPVWTRTRDHTVKKLNGEIGILKHAVLHENLPTRCFLVIEYEKYTYMGCLVFDDATFCKQIHDLLQLHIGSSIKDIGSIDLSHIL